MSESTSETGQLVAIIGTMDTRGWEVDFLRETLGRFGVKALAIDAGWLNPASSRPDIGRSEVIRSAGFDPAKFDASKLRRDQIVQLMGRGLAHLLGSMKNLAGVIAIGGNQGMALASVAMQELPIGLPKIIVSSVASGNIRPFIRHKDICVMFSVTDLEFGPNPIETTILTNAAAAMVGMITHNKGKPARSKHFTVAVTALGSTDGATRECVRLLRGASYQPIVFHASGAGGDALEELIEEGFVDAVIYLNLHEIVGEVFPMDIYKPHKPRLTSASMRCLPVVLAPGSINYFVFGPPDSVPKDLKGNRKVHHHNPFNTNIRLREDELVQVAERLAEKINSYAGPVTLIIPLRGFSVLDSLGGVLYDPEGNKLFIDRLKRSLNKNVRIDEVDTEINDPQFAYAVAKALFDLTGRKVC